jgi:hypothetical protein
MAEPHLGLEARVRLTTAVHTLTVAAEHGDEAFTACLRLLVNEWQWVDPVDSGHRCAWLPCWPAC